jgi:hypothetical protein
VIAQSVRNAGYVIFGGPEVQAYILDFLRLDPEQMYSANLFATFHFLENAGVRRRWAPWEVVYEYLRNLNFLGAPSAASAPSIAFGCPICRTRLTSAPELYRHVYRGHNPYPGSVMNQMRKGGLPAGRFACRIAGCAFEGDSYDKLTSHVIERHPIDLLHATLPGLEKHREACPGLREWIGEELKRDEVRRQAPVVRLSRRSEFARPDPGPPAPSPSSGSVPYSGYGPIPPEYR